MIPQHKPTFDNEERQALIEYLQQEPEPYYTEFKKTKQLEEMIASYTKSRYCIMMPNGTLSLSCALLAFGVKPGDEVICPALTMAATATSVQLIGATPVFCDIKGLTMDPEDLERKITDKTKAVIYVSLNNHYDNIVEIKNICNRYSIDLLEDAAQSLGCWNSENHVGTHGRIGSFSFSTPKIISTGQGGALITDDSELNHKIRLIKNFGRPSSGTSDHYITFGVNLKITDLQAVIGIEQMKKLPQRVERMKHIHARYYSHLKDIMMEKPYDGYIPWFVCIYVDNRQMLIDHLKENGIQTRCIYPVLPNQPAFDDLSNERFPEATVRSLTGLWLPSFITITDEQIDFICNTIKEFNLKIDL